VLLLLLVCVCVVLSTYFCSLAAGSDPAVGEKEIERGMCSV
jgi:hypothetical protein